MKNKKIIFGILCGMVCGILATCLLFYFLYTKESIKKDNNKEVVAIIYDLEKQDDNILDNKDGNIPQKYTKEESQAKDKPTQKPNDKNTKKYICDYCKTEVDRIFYIGEFMFCPPCEEEYKSKFAECYECGYTTPREDMIGDTCTTCYDKRRPGNDEAEDNYHEDETDDEVKDDWQNNIPTPPQDNVSTETE